MGQDRVELVRQALRGVVDPELGLDIVAMGLVYDIREEDGRLVVEMTLTTPGCPVSESLPDDAWSAAADALGPAGLVTLDVRVVWDPPWTPELLSAEAKASLGR
jgi:metal-sulfur cluster biosynthetic enzyme